MYRGFGLCIANITLPLKQKSIFFPQSPCCFAVLRYGFGFPAWDPGLVAETIPGFASGFPGLVTGYDTRRSGAERSVHSNAYSIRLIRVL